MTAISAVTPRGPTSDRAEVQKIARDLQAVFVQEMLKAMRDTVPDGTTRSHGEDTFRVLFDQELATKLSAGMEGSLTRAIEDQLLGLLHGVRTDGGSEG